MVCLRPCDLLSVREATTLFPALISRFATARSVLARKWRIAFFGVGFDNWARNRNRNARYANAYQDETGYQTM